MLRFLLIVAALVCASPAFAQDADEEIIVTGSRLRTYEGYAVPHVSVTRRADFAVVEVNIRNDTRATDARRAELVEALNRLEASATRSGMTLALVDDDVGIVRPYTLAAAQQLMTGDGRPDTTSLTIRLRTAVTPADTLETIHDRVERFVTNLPEPGRVEMTLGDTDLSMVNLEQYRDGMLQRILGEGRSLSAQVGGAREVAIGGLEGQVAFHRTGDLDLILFIPYELTLSLSAQP